MDFKITSSWNEYLDFFPDERKDIYYTEEYVKLYESSIDEPVCFVCSEGENYMLFPYLRRRFTFNGTVYYDFETAYGYGGAIFNKVDEAFMSSAYQIFANYCKDNNYVCGFVRFHPLLNNIEQYDTIGKLLVDRPTVAIDVRPSEEEIWMQQLTSKNRNTVKKATANGLQFIKDKDFKYLDKFIALYNRTMQKVGADDFYIFENDYYYKFRENIKDSFLGVVLHGEEVVSGAMFFYSKDFGHYHLSGSNPEYLYLNPNNFMLWEAAKALREVGVKHFHLGGGSTPDENNSLLEFKSRFSKNRYVFHIGKTMFNSEVYDALCAEWIKNNNEEKVLALRNHLLKYKY